MSERIISKEVILIGGAPTTGKSFLANLISQRFKIPWISTDQLRNVMLSVADRSLHSKLFVPQEFTTGDYVNKFTKEEIVAMEFQKGEGVWPGIKWFVGDGYPWRNGFVIEGVNILPRLIARDFGDNKKLRVVFLIDEDEDRIRNVIYTRGLTNDPEKYPDETKDKEIEWVLEFSKRLKLEAEKYGYPCVEIRKDKDDLGVVLKALGF